MAQLVHVVLVDIVTLHWGFTEGHWKHWPQNEDSTGTTLIKMYRYTTNGSPAKRMNPKKFCQVKMSLKYSINIVFNLKASTDPRVDSRTGAYWKQHPPFSRQKSFFVLFQTKRSSTLVDQHVCTHTSVNHFKGQVGSPFLNSSRQKFLWSYLVCFGEITKNETQYTQKDQLINGSPPTHSLKPFNEFLPGLWSWHIFFCAAFQVCDPLTSQVTF